MTINATCPKGHTLTLEEKLAGKKIRCPRCQTVFEVPSADGDDWENDEDEAVSEKPLRRPRRRDDEDEENEDDRPRGRARSRDDDDDDDDRPRKKARARVRDDDDDDDDDEEDEIDDATKRRLKRELKKKQLKLVDVGLLLHYIKLMIYIIGIILGITMAVLMAVAGAQAADALEQGAIKAGQVPEGGIEAFVLFGTVTVMAFVFFLLILVISQIAPLLGVVGSFLCCWVPKKSEAKGVIITSLSFDLVAMVAGLLGMLASFNVFGMTENKTQNMRDLLNYIIYFCSVSGWLTFLTFLRNLGKYLGEPGVGNEALNLIARLVVMVITLVVDFILIIAFGRLFVGVVLAIIIAIGTSIIWFIIFIFVFYMRQLKLLSAMRRAVQNRL